MSRFRNYKKRLFNKDYFKFPNIYIYEWVQVDNYVLEIEKL